MSRIGNAINNVPSSVLFTVNGNNLTVSGPRGSVVVYVDKNVLIDLTSGIRFSVVDGLNRKDRLKASSVCGTLVRIVGNAVNDVNNLFFASINMIGVGLKASVKGDFLYMFVGFSHDVVFKIWFGLEVKVVDAVNISISGIDRQKVMQFASMIRSVKPPEPYKGKGLFVNGEKIIRKEVKKK
jgi:large subunit ribosomal protein L6